MLLTLADARALIRRNRAAVERVARALLERETLTAAEIDQFIMVAVRKLRDASLDHFVRAHQN